MDLVSYFWFVFEVHNHLIHLSQFYQWLLLFLIGLLSLVDLFQHSEILIPKLVDRGEVVRQFLGSLDRSLCFFFQSFDVNYWLELTGASHWFARKVGQFLKYVSPLYSFVCEERIDLHINWANRWFGPAIFQVVCPLSLNYSSLDFSWRFLRWRLLCLQEWTLHLLKGLCYFCIRAQLRATSLEATYKWVIIERARVRWPGFNIMLGYFVVKLHVWSLYHHRIWRAGGLVYPAHNILRLALSRHREFKTGRHPIWLSTVTLIFQLWPRIRFACVLLWTSLPRVCLGNWYKWRDSFRLSFLGRVNNLP